MPVVLTTDEERDLLISAVETSVTLRRVDALLALHWLLTFWIPMHIGATALMLALLVVHIVQVTYFNVRLTTTSLFETTCRWIR